MPQNGVIMPLYGMHKKFRHYDWKVCYEVLQSLGIRRALMLNIGCGDGRRGINYQELVNLLIGLDINLESLKVAMGRRIPVIQGDALKLPFKDRSFGVVTAFHVIEHITDDLSFLNEMHRVLKKRGHAIVLTPNRRRLSSIYYRIFQRKYPVDPTHVREYTIEDLQALLMKSKFKHYEVRPIGLTGYMLSTPIGLIHNLSGPEITTVPRFLSKYCDQLMVLLKA